MRYALFLIALMMPVIAVAQQVQPAPPVAPTPQAAFAAALAQNLSQALADNEALRTQLKAMTATSMPLLTKPNSEDKASK